LVVFCVVYWLVPSFPARLSSDLAERAVEAVDRFAISERARLSLPTVRRALAEARMSGEAA
jgi:hypothetical protein